MPAIEALKAHVPTSRHAEMLFGLLVDLLGDRAVVSTANERTLRTLFLRDAFDPRSIVPWPVARLSTRGRIGWVSPTYDTATGEIVPEPERPAGKAYKLRGLGPGQIDLCDGSATIRIVYGDGGGFLESRIDDRTPSRLAEIPAALASKRAQPAELIASCVAMFDPGRHGPGRVRMPAPVPGGPDGAWMTGLHAARRALYAGRVPAEARFVVADGVAGSAVGVGLTLEAATTAFEAMVAASPPEPSREWHTAWDDYDDDGNLLRRGKPPRPGTASPEEEGEPGDSSERWSPESERRADRIDLTGGTLRLAGPTADVPLPEITVATVPCAVIPLAATPTVPPPFGRWERTIGARGATAHVARLVGPEGFLQIGERVLWQADPRTLDDALDEIDTHAAETPSAIDADSPFARFVRFRSRTYRWVEARDGRPARFEFAGGSSGPHFDGGDMDGDLEACVVRRHVKVRRGTA